MTTTPAVAWVSFGPITDPYRQAVYKEIERHLEAGHSLDELDVEEDPAWTGLEWGWRQFTQPFRVVVARTLPRLDPEREQEPVPVEGPHV